MRRRAFLGGASGLTLFLTGCTSVDDPDSASPTSTPTATTASGLDLREANVTAVALHRQDGDVRFDVTLYHDDDGEEGYANWWQVEDLDGQLLGRRELAHPHGTQEFTRSASIAVPDSVGCVVVRGHDQTHGYGGRVVLIDLETGATRGIDQGGDPVTFSTADCP